MTDETKLVDAPNSDARTWRVARRHYPAANTIYKPRLRDYLALTTDELDELLSAYALPIQQQRDAAQAELHLWKVALHDLTAGGSEFANDPKACVAYVRNRYSTQHELVKKSIIAKYRAESERDALRAEVAFLKLGTRRHSDEAWIKRVDALREALKKVTQMAVDQDSDGWSDKIEAVTRAALEEK